MKRVILITLLAAACGSSGSKLTVMLTDAPGDFKAAVVTVTQINLVGSGGVTTLSSAKVTTNLLSLSNDVKTLVDGVVVQSGTYSELRFVISGGYVEVQNATGGGTTIYASSPDYEGLPPGATVGGTLKMPSFEQSGLKVTLPGGSVDAGGDAKILLVDFDVQQSFGHDAGNSGSWVMHPVMNATDFQLSGNVNVTATLAASVSLPSVTLADFSATLTNSGGSVKSIALAPVAAGSATFGASFKYLIPGSYSLSLAAPAGVTIATSPGIPVSVTLASGATVQENLSITSAVGP